MTAGWLWALGAFAATLLVVAIVRRTPVAKRLADFPNERSLHSEPTPRIGGIGIVASAVTVLWAQGVGDYRLLALVTLGLFLLSLADDLRPLAAALRLTIHFLAATIVVAGVATDLRPAGGGFPTALDCVVVVALAWMTNLFNFMDGSDGLAGGMAAIGFGVLAWAAAGAADTSLFAVSAGLSAASIGFLVYNFPPARVFLGDAGSIPLGFLAGSLGWVGFLRGAWPAWFPVVVFSPFVMDATVTLALRAMRREPLFQAHCSHHYQVLVSGGWSHRQLALAAWALMAVVAGSAAAALNATADVTAVILAGVGLAYVLIGAAVRRHARG